MRAFPGCATVLLAEMQCHARRAVRLFQELNAPAVLCPKRQLMPSCSVRRTLCGRGGAFQLALFCLLLGTRFGKVFDLGEQRWKQQGY